jgi:hypothetical protein
MFQQEFRPEAVASMHSAIQECISTFLDSIFRSPENFMEHIDVYGPTLISMVFFGFWFIQPFTDSQAASLSKSLMELISKQDLNL